MSKSVLSRGLAMRAARVAALAIDSSSSGPPTSDLAASAARSGRHATEPTTMRSEEHTSELQSRGQFVCRLLLEKKEPRADLCAAANLLSMMEGKESEPQNVHLLDASLVLLTDHDLNASTFAASSVASTGSDLTS